MASPRKSQHRVQWAFIITVFFLTLAILPSRTVGRISSQTGRRNDINNHNQGKEMKLALGSTPPRCINRCMNCRPCIAVLVIPPHRKNNNFRQEVSSSSALTPQEEENYYLLLWKCRCKNKLFQP